MSNPFELSSALASVAAKMKSDFDLSASLQHRGAKGAVREGQLVAQYLTKYLPRTVEAVHNGEAISVDGQTSTQCDVLILDPRTPPLWDEKEYRVVPIECVFGVVEVKSKLDSTQLRDAWTKIAAIKRMEKKAFRQRPNEVRTRTIYGKTWDHVPTSGIVFAYDSIDLRTLGDTMAELAAAEKNPEHCVDSVWVLNEGYLAWLSPHNGNVDVAPDPGADIAFFKSSPDEVLMALTIHLHEHYGTAWSPEFRIIDYLGTAPLGMFMRRWRSNPIEKS